MNELILKIPMDEVEKIQYALNHVQLTDDEHIDSALCRLNDVIDEGIENMEKRRCKFCEATFDDSLNGEEEFRLHLLQTHEDEMMDECAKLFLV